VSQKDGLSTIPQLMRSTFDKFGAHDAMGVRRTVRVVEKEVTVQQDGKPVTKKHRVPWQTDYEFNSFTDMARDITAFGAGLVGTGGTQTPLKFGDKLSIFAGTRPEWQVTAQAAFEHGLVVVTVYPSLGPDALSFSLNQTDASHLVCQASLMDTVVRSAGQLNDSLRCVIYLDDLEPSDVQKYQKALGREVVAWKDVMARGQELVRRNDSSARVKRAPQPQDVAVIMYTSGSTGTPKGVLMSHANIVAAVSGIGAFVPEPLCETDVYIAYLPLAHVLELCAEMCVLAHGGALGFSSPLTLRDDGVCDDQGKPAGDLGKLRPTIMAAVPLILDRLRAGVQEQVNKGGPITQLLFKTAYALKKRAYLRGHKTPLIDKLVFRKVSARFGGRLRYLLSGGAPLSPETHEFINLTVGAPVMQGYG
jgi:long-chain acyl-CoA synthetase